MNASLLSKWVDELGRVLLVGALIFAVSVTLAKTAAASPLGLIYQSDFSAVTSPLPQGWTGNGQIVHDVQCEGASVLSMEDTDAAGYAEVRSDLIEVSPEEQYELRAMSRIDDPARGGTVAIFVREYEGTRATATWHYLLWPKAPGWVEHTISFTTGPHTTNVRLYFYPASHGPNAVGQAWFGGVQLGQVPKVVLPEGVLWPVPATLKPNLELEHPRVLYTPADIERARKNLGTSGPDWARKIYQDILTQAKRPVWMGLPDNAIRNFMPEPYSYYMYEISSVCPDGTKMSPAGWVAPGKVMCGSGRMLPNADHPDDGTGWKDPQGNMHYFVARWNGFVIDDFTKALQPLAYAYVLSDDIKYAHTAAVILDAIATIYPTAIEGPLNYPGLSPGREGGRLDRPYYQVARRLLWYVNAVDLIWNSGELDVASPTNPALTIKENVVANLLLNGADYCYREAQKPGYVDALHNGTADYNKGVLAVGSLLGIDEYVDWALNGPTSMRNMVSNNIDRDGNYYETSASYGEYTTGLYLEIAEILYNLRTPDYPEGINLYKDPQFERMYVGAKQKNSIAGRLPAYGDSGPDTKVGTTAAFDGLSFSQALQFYVRAEDDISRHRYAQALVDVAGGNVEDRLTSVWQLFNIDAVESTGLVPTPSSPVSDVLGGKGLVLLRSGFGASQRGAFMRYGPTLNHGHRDEMALMIYADGRELSFDSGYHDAHYRVGWQYRTVSHIATVVNEKCQLSAESAGGSLNFFANTDGLSVADVSDESAYASEGVSLYRRLLALVDTSEKDSYLVDIFRVAGGTRRDYSFHGLGRNFTAEGLELSPPGPGSLANEGYAWGPRVRPDGRIEGYGDQGFYWNPPPGNGYGFLSAPQWADGDASWSATWSHRDRAGLRLRMLPQEGRQIILADGPSLMGVKYLLARDEGEEPSQFVSVIEPFAGEPQILAVTPMALHGVEAEQELPPVAFSVDLAGAKDYFLSTLAEQGFSASDAGTTFTTDAPFAHIRQVGPRTERLHMTMGSELTTEDIGVVSPYKAFLGTVVEVDPEGGSLLIASQAPFPEQLVGSRLTVDASEYSHNSPYTIERLVREGAYDRVFLDPPTLVLARGQLAGTPDGNGLPNLVTLPFANNVTREGPNSYFDGKLVVGSGGASAVIERVGGNYAKLFVDDATGFVDGEDLTIYDVKAGDMVSIPITVTVARQEANTFLLTAPTPVWISLPDADHTRLLVQGASGELREPASEVTDGRRLFWVEPGDTGRVTFVIE